MYGRTSRVVMPVAVVLATASLVAGSVAPAHAEPGPPVFPGMEIRQDTNLCTIGFVDVATRTAFSAGHCHGSGPVTDRYGTLIEWSNQLGRAQVASILQETLDEEYATDDKLTAMAESRINAAADMATA